MSERATVALLAVGALLAAYLLFGPKPAPERDTFARPVSTEMRADGLGVAAGWLRANGIRVRVLRGRYSELDPDAQDGAAPPSTGNVLIIHSPVHLMIREAERKRLQVWVERGNTLLIAAALADTPGWSSPVATANSPRSDLYRLAGLTAMPVGTTHDDPDAVATTRMETPLVTALAPDRAHPFFAGVRTVEGLSDYPANGFRLRAGDAVSMPLVMARTGPEPRAGDGLWLLPQGRGRIIVLALGSAFTNRAIGRADNAALLGALLGASLGPQGSVWFDDAHQGAVSFYNVRALARDPRLYATFAIVLGLWFTWVLGLQRLAAKPAAPLPDETALVGDAAGLLGRTVSEEDAARLMLERFVRRHAPRGLSQSERDEFRWAATAGPGAVAASDTLRAATDALRRSRRVKLVPVRRAIVILEDLLT